MTNYKLLFPILTFALGPILSYVSLPLITSNVSAKEYGIYTYFLSLLSIVSFISLLPALNSTVSRFGSKSSEEYINDMCSLKRLYCMSFFIFSLLVFFINYFSLIDNSSCFVFVASAILCVNIFNVLKSYLLINNNKAAYSSLVILISLFQYGYLFYAVNTENFEVSDILLGNVILLLFLASYKARSIISFINLKPRSNTRNVKVIKFVAISFFISLSTIIYNNTDKIMMDALLEHPRTIAIYQVSYQIFGFPIESMYALISIFIPAFLYRAFDKDRDLYRKNLTVTFKIIIFIIFNLSQLLLLSGDFLKSILLDSDYITDDALPLVFLISQSIFLLYLICTNVFIVYDKRNFVIVSLTISSIVNIVLNFILIPKFGYVGAALSTLASYTLLLALVATLLYKLFSIIFLDRSDLIYISFIPVLYYLFNERIVLWVLAIGCISFFYFKFYIKDTYLNLLRGI